MGGVSGAGPSPIQTRVVPVAKAKVKELIEELEHFEKTPDSAEKTAGIKRVVAELKAGYNIDVDKGTILVGPGRTPHQVEVQSGDKWRPVKTLSSPSEKAKLLWLHTPMMQEAAEKSSKAATGHVEAEGLFTWTTKGALAKGHVGLGKAGPVGKLRTAAQFMPWVGGYFKPSHSFEKFVAVDTGKSPLSFTAGYVNELAKEVFSQDPTPDYLEGATYLTGQLIASYSDKISAITDKDAPHLQSLKRVVDRPAFAEAVTAASSAAAEARKKGASPEQIRDNLYLQLGRACAPFVQELMKDEQWQKTKTAFGITRPDRDASKKALKKIFDDMEGALKSKAPPPATGGSAAAPGTRPRTSSAPSALPAGSVAAPRAPAAPPSPPVPRPRSASAGALPASGLVPRSARGPAAPAPAALSPSPGTPPVVAPLTPVTPHLSHRAGSMEELGGVLDELLAAEVAPPAAETVVPETLREQLKDDIFALIQYNAAAISSSAKATDWGEMNPVNQLATALKPGSLPLTDARKEELLQGILSDVGLPAAISLTKSGYDRENLKVYLERQVELHAGTLTDPTPPADSSRAAVPPSAAAAAAGAAGAVARAAAAAAAGAAAAARTAAARTAAAAAAAPAPAADPKAGAIQRWAEEHRSRINGRTDEGLSDEDKVIFGQFQELIKPEADERNKQFAIGTLSTLSGEGSIQEWLRAFAGRVFPEASSPPK